MKDQQPKHTGRSRMTTYCEPKRVRKSITSIALQTAKTPMMDVRFLPVAIEFPYMFDKVCGDLLIDRRWAPAFTQTCVEIDQLLGDSTHGFCWRAFFADAIGVDWLWSLGVDYGGQTRITWGPDGQTTEFVPPAIDPMDNLQDKIWAITEKGKRRALSSQLGAANEPVFHRGGLL